MRKTLSALVFGAAVLAAPAAHAGGSIYYCYPWSSTCGAGYSCQGSTSYSWVPGYIANARRGDLSFRTPVSSDYGHDPVSTILEYMGQRRSHVGMLTDQYHVRHNTRQSDMNTLIGKVQRRPGATDCNPGTGYIDPNWLKYGGPNDGLQTADGYAFVKDSDYTNTIINQSSDPQRSYWVQYTAQALENMWKSYRLYAYTREDYANNWYNGNMCSGTILEASHYSPYGFDNQWMDPYTRWNYIWNYAPPYPVTPAPGVSTAANCPNGQCNGLYPALVQLVYNTVVTTPGLNPCTTFTGTQGISYGIARQIINCFAYDQCGITNGVLDAEYSGAFSSGWNTTPGQEHFTDYGYTISPDQIVDQVMTGEKNYAPAEYGVQTGGAYWDPTTTYQCTKTDVCGDGACTGAEDCSTCPGDCGYCAPDPIDDPPPPPSCFVAGTPITLADGTTKPIEEIDVGDQVLSWDEDIHAQVVGDVRHLFVHPHTTRLVRLNGIVTTPEHRFFVDGKWVPAAQLAIGDALQLATPSATETTTRLQSFTDDVTTYNFEVARYHDYYAGGVLVHNMKYQP